jgi:hypothetical protein
MVRFLFKVWKATWCMGNKRRQRCDARTYSLQA